jgi:replicative DNA helicase
MTYFQNPEDGYKEVTFEYIMSQSWESMNDDRQILLMSRIRFVLTQLLWPSSITYTYKDGSTAVSLEQRSEAVKIMIFKMIPDPRVFIDDTCIRLFEICVELRQEQKPINFENVADLYHRTAEDKKKVLKKMMPAHHIMSWMMENLDPCHIYYGGPAMIHVVEDHINRIYDSFTSLRLSQIYRYKEIALAHGYSLKEIDDLFLESENKIKDMKPKPNVGLSQQLNELWDSMVNFKQGLTSGLDNLDQITKGWKDGCLYVVAGRPAMGKTAVSLTFALNAMRAQPKKVMFFSLEMPSTQLLKRLASNWSGIAHSIFDQPYDTLSDGFKTRMAESFSQINGMPLEIIDRAALSIEEMRSICDVKKRSEDIGLIIVDYLQLMTAPAMIREQEISQISRGLKALAKEIGCPVIALAQINRGVEQRANKRPLLSDLRESGAIEQDADVVMMLYREHAYDDLASETDMEIIVTKNRHGECKTAHVEFLGSCQRIADRQSF